MDSLGMHMPVNIARRSTQKRFHAAINAFLRLMLVGTEPVIDLRLITRAGSMD